MKNQAWFAGNFCPETATCSIEKNGLTPVKGPIIRSMHRPLTDDSPFLAEIRQFSFDPNTQGRNIEWMKCEGQAIGLTQYIDLYPIIGYIYGETSSRELFPLPDLRQNGQPADYYICVKNGETPKRP